MLVSKAGIHTAVFTHKWQIASPITYQLSWFGFYLKSARAAVVLDSVMECVHLNREHLPSCHEVMWSYISKFQKCAHPRDIFSCSNAF